MGGSPAYKNILFCTDFSDDAHMAFAHALDLTRKYKAKLYLLHIIPPHNPCGTPPDTTHTPKETPSDERDQQLQQQALKAIIKKYVHELDEADDYDIRVCAGSPDIEIIRFARQFHIDMIILGAQGRPEKERRVFIRTAANVSKFAPCQVVAIRSPKGETTQTDATR